MSGRRWIGVALVGLAACGGCGSGSSGSGDSEPSGRPAGCPPIAAPVGHPLRIVTTVAPLTDIVETLVAGTLADVVGIVPEGVDSHTFALGPSAARHLERADIVVLNGLGLEAPTRELALADMSDEAVLCELGDEVLSPSDYLFDVAFPEDDGVPNPHLWTNPPMVEAYAVVLHGLLATALPEDAEVLAANLAAFRDRIARLDQAIRVAVSTIPAEQRLLVTYHDAFAYFGREYGFTVIGAVQPASFDEPTPREVARLIDQIESSGARAIFGSEVFPSPVLAHVAAETGVTYVDELRDDVLPGEPRGPEHSWFGMTQSNVITIVEALGGDASAVRAL